MTYGDFYDYLSTLVYIQFFERIIYSHHLYMSPAFSVLVFPQVHTCSISLRPQKHGISSVKVYRFLKLK